MKYVRNNSTTTTITGKLTIPLSPLVATISVLPNSAKPTPVAGGFMRHFSVDELLHETVPFFDGHNFDRYDGEALKAAFVRESNKHILTEVTRKYAKAFFPIIEKEVHRVESGVRA